MKIKKIFSSLVSLLVIFSGLSTSFSSETFAMQNSTYDDNKKRIISVIDSTKKLTNNQIDNMENSVSAQAIVDTLKRDPKIQEQIFKFYVDDENASKFFENYIDNVVEERIRAVKINKEENDRLQMDNERLQTELNGANGEIIRLKDIYESNGTFCCCLPKWVKTKYFKYGLTFGIVGTTIVAALIIIGVCTVIIVLK